MKYGMSQPLLRNPSRKFSYLTSNCQKHIGRPVAHSRGDQSTIDDSVDRLGHIIKDDFAKFREYYRIPTHPIVLAHGLLGFDELRLAGQYLPGVQYWRGIKEAYHRKGIKVITSKYKAFNASNIYP